MTKIERYELFHNSSDFDSLINKSFKDIQAHSIPGELFVKKYLPQIEQDKSAFILYEDGKPIGYEAVIIKNNEFIFGFTYVVPSKRGLGYSYSLRKKTIETFSNKLDILVIAIKKRNQPSLKGVKRIAEELNCKYSSETFTHDNGEVYEKLTISRPD